MSENKDNFIGIVRHECLFDLQHSCSLRSLILESQDYVNCMHVDKMKFPHLQSESSPGTTKTINQKKKKKKRTTAEYARNKGIK